MELLYYLKCLILYNICVFTIIFIQGKAISLAESCFGAGTIFGPSLGGFLYEAGGFQTPFLVAGIISKYKHDA